MNFIRFFIIYTYIFIVPGFVFASNLLDFSISDNVVDNYESIQVEFNITNAKNIPLDIYGYTTKGTLEIFDENSQKWLASNNLQPTTINNTKAKIRLAYIDNQETQIYFSLVDRKNGKSYSTVTKSIWVGSFEFDYINVVNEHLLSAQSSMSVSLNEFTLETSNSSDETFNSEISYQGSYIGMVLVGLSYAIIILISVVMIKYNNGTFKALDTRNNSNVDNISSLIDTWKSNS